MLSSLKVLFLGKPFWGISSEGSQILSKQLSYKQLLTLWVSSFYAEQLKSFIFGGLPLGGPPNLAKIIVSPTTFYIVSFKFLCWAVQKLRFGRGAFWGVCPLIGLPNLAKIIVSHTTSYILSFNFICWAVQKFRFWGPYWGVLPPRPPNLVKIIVSHTTFYIVSFIFLC